MNTGAIQWTIPCDQIGFVQPSSSRLLSGDKLLLVGSKNCNPGSAYDALKEPCLTMVDGKTGKILWRREPFLERIARVSTRRADSSALTLPTFRRDEGCIACRQPSGLTRSMSTEPLHRHTFGPFILCSSECIKSPTDRLTIDAELLSKRC